MKSGIAATIPLFATEKERGDVKPSGVVYTRDWVVDFVLDLAGYTPEGPLAQGCIIEPSCGEGAFLKAIIRRLCEHLQSKGILDRAHLSDCIRAYDSDPRAVSASRELAGRILFEFGIGALEALEISEEWIIEADFLLADVPEARWVVGNPPYVRATQIPRERREQYCRELSTFTLGSDIYVGFFEKGLKSLSSNGTLCYICSDRWLQNQYGARLRSFVSSSFSLDAHIRMHGVDAFEDEVAAYPAISLIHTGPDRQIGYIECQPSFSSLDVPEVLLWLSEDRGRYRSGASAGTKLAPISGSRPVPLATEETMRLVSCVSKKFPLIEDAGVRMGIGVASGCDAVYITEDPTLVEEDRLLPLFYMRDFRSGQKGRKRWLVNPWDSDGLLVDLDDYPKLKSYFEHNAERLKRRRVAKDHPDAWYRTLDKPDFSLLGKEMLLFPDMAKRSDPVYSDGSLYPHHNCYWITSDEWDIKSLGGLLMSDVIERCIDAYGVKMRGSTLRFQAQFLRLLHIPQASSVARILMDKLASAFEEDDRELANAAAREVYDIAYQKEGI